jgi:hypothetical protein
MIVYPSSPLSYCVLVALALGGALMTPLAQTDAAATKPKPLFPTLNASNLERKTFHLPQEFEGEKNLCLIAFKRNQQRNVDTWIGGLKSLATPSGLRVYELPTITKGPRWFDTWLDGRMRAGIHDPSAREMTITLYLNKKAFRKALDITSEKTINAILIDKQGNVLWRAEGDYTEAKGRELLSALGKLGEGHKE